MTVRQWCDYLGGTLEGNADIVISYPAKIEEAKEGAITFVAHPKYLPFAYTSKASAIIIPRDLELKVPVSPSLIKVDSPYTAFSLVLEKFNKPFDSLTGIDPSATVDQTAMIGENVFIGANASIGKNVRIGNDVKIFPNVTISDDSEIGEGTVLFAAVNIYRHCRVGKQCIIHSGTVIGSDGFGFSPQPDGSYWKIPQLGNVVIEDHVEIGANCTLDRATLGSTIIHKGVKMDNLIHVAHNVEIGEHTVIAAQTGIAGSTKIGKHCQIGGQVGIVGHLIIADGTKINAQSGVSKSISGENRAITGSPAFDYTASLRSQSIYRHLPELLRRLEELEKKVRENESLGIEEKLPLTNNQFTK